jgi:hypothetical protein
MFRTVSLQRRNEPVPPYHKKTAVAAAAFRSPAATFLQNFESAIKAASMPPRNDVGLSPCAGRRGQSARQLGAGRATMAKNGGRPIGLPKAGECGPLSMSTAKLKSSRLIQRILVCIPESRLSRSPGVTEAFGFNVLQSGVDL